MTRSRLKIIVPVTALCALLAVFAVVGALAGCGSSGGSSSGTSDSSGVSGASTGHAAASEPRAMAGAAVQGKPSSAGGSTSYAADIPAASAQGPHYLLRNGALGLQVPRGTLLSAVNRITALTAGLNGYVVSSSVGSEPIPWPQASGATGSTSQSSGDQPVASSGSGYATVIVRVPGVLFDTALQRFAAAGTVQSVSTSSDDVTSQYVDLRARLQHYRAVERRLVSFLGATTNVNQALEVQDRINNVQLTIEELTAQFKELRQTTTYGTITVSLTERGRHVTTTATTSFWGTFRHSLSLLARGARDTALAIVAVLPFVLVLGGLGLAGWAAARRYRRRRPPAEPSVPA